MLCVHLKLHYGIIPVVRHGYNAVVPLPVLYTLLTDIMFNQLLLCQTYKFSIPIGYDLIFKTSLIFVKQNDKHDMCSCISNVYITFKYIPWTAYGSFLKCSIGYSVWPSCFYNLWKIGLLTSHTARTIDNSGLVN